MTSKTKKTILLDLDGVLNNYTGNYDEKFIPQAKAGAFEFLKNLSKKYKIKIFTSRNLLLVSEWLVENDLKQFVDEVTNVKVPSYLIIDDRCITFTGDYFDLSNKIEKFNVWYK